MNDKELMGLFGIITLAACALYLGIAAYGECREAGNSVLFCVVAVG